MQKGSNLTWGAMSTELQRMEGTLVPGARVARFPAAPLLLVSYLVIELLHSLQTFADSKERPVYQHI